jgi:hypothetical protein
MTSVTVDFLFEFYDIQIQFLPVTDVNSSSEAGFGNGLSMSWTHDYHRNAV